MELLFVTLIEYAEYGVITVLFVWILTETIKRNNEREDKLYKTIDTYNEELKKVAQLMDKIYDEVQECNKAKENKERKNKEE